MADNSLNAIYLGNGCDSASVPITGFRSGTFSAAADEFYETTVYFTGLAASGPQQFSPEHPVLPVPPHALWLSAACASQPE